MSRLMPLTTITIKPFAPQIQYRFLCSRRPMTKTTFSAPLARSFPRVASPEAVFFPAAAIQLSARIALLRRAKARWILFGGSPALCSQYRAGETRCAGIGALAVSPRGMGPVYLQIRSHADRIRYSCEAFSAFGTDAGDCACASRRASFFAAFFAACSCRNRVSCR